MVMNVVFVVFVICNLILNAFMVIILFCIEDNNAMCMRRFDEHFLAIRDRIDNIERIFDEHFLAMCDRIDKIERHTRSENIRRCIVNGYNPSDCGDNKIFIDRKDIDEVLDELFSKYK